jgi:nucleoside-diphosphate-sugar epimerase
LTALRKDNLRSLVFGGTGLIGRHLIRRLVVADHQVDVVTRRAEQVLPGARAIVADISEPQWQAKIPSLGGYDVICHLAYATTGNEAYDRAVTVGSVHALLRDSSIAGVGHIVYVGSMTVFGQQLSDGVIDESAPRIGDTSYGANKLAAARAVLESDMSGMVSVLHPTGVYAKGSKRLETYAEMFRNGYIPMLRGSGYNNVVHADDVAAAIIACLDRKAGRRADEYIINGEVIPYADWFLALERRIGVASYPRVPTWLSPMVRGPFRRAALALKIRPALQVPAYKVASYERKTIFSAEKAARDFGFAPVHGFRDTLYGGC